MSNPGRERFNQLLFYSLVLLTGYLAFVVLQPFLGSLGWAAIFAVMFYPVQVQLSPRLGPNRAALLTTLMAGVLIVGPAVMIVSVFAREVPIVIEYLKGVSVTPDQIQEVWDVVRRRSPFELPADPTSMLRQGAQRTLAFLAPRAGAVVADVVSTLGALLIMLFALFFLLRDGHTLGRQVRELLPLAEHERERMIAETRDLVVASVGAGLAVAVAQGAIGGVAFWLLGLAAPVIWAVVMAMTSLIPVVGAALVWLPTVVWLLLSGEVTRALILLVIGVLGISMVDNVLRPLLLSGRTSASGLVVFLGLLGGVSAFGFVGLVLGPIVLVTAGSLLRAFTRPDLIESPIGVTDNPPPSSRSITLGLAVAASSHEVWMRLALEQALRARDLAEVPVGAVVVVEERVVGSGFNQPISAVDPTAHAEIVALRTAARQLGNYRLTGATLYVTVEPCLMCVGAMIHARVGRVVYGTTEPRTGAIVSVARAHETPGLNHRVEAIGGVLEEECRRTIRTFFEDRRGSR